MISKITNGVGGKVGTLALALMVMMSLAVGSVAAAEGDAEITIEDADGNAVEGATVTAVDDTGTEIESVESDADGVASFSGVGAAGDSITFEVSHADYLDASQTESLATGETTTATISLTESHLVEVEGDETVDATVTIEDAEGNTHTVDVASGEFGEVSGVADGDATITAEDQNDSTVSYSETITIDGDKSVALDFENESYTVQDINTGDGSGVLGEDGPDNVVIVLVVVLLAIAAVALRQ